MKAWGTDDGLPQNSVIAMTQARDGYLWLGTLNGLVRYDGFTFRVFDENNTPGLSSSRIVYLFEDSRRVLWIGMETAGIVMLKDGQVVSPPQLALGGRERRLLSACEDAEGAVWLYTANGGIWRYFEGRFTPFVVMPGTVHGVIAEVGGDVWVAHVNGQQSVGRVSDHPLQELPITQQLAANQLDLLLASRRGGYWRFADGTIQRWSSTNRLAEPAIVYQWPHVKVTTACEDRHGNLVVGTANRGVYWFDSQGGHSHLSTDGELSNDFILSLVVDHEGTLWVGTDGGGLNRVKRKAFDTLAATHDWVVQSVTEDAEGGLWIASNDHGVNRWHEGVLVQGLGQFSSASTRSVLVDRKQNVYLGTRVDGLRHLQRGLFLSPLATVPMNSQVNAIHESVDGTLSFGTENGLVQLKENQWSILTSAQGLSAEAVTAVAEDPKAGLWIGTQGGGLNLVARDGRITVHRRRDGELPSDDITALALDADGALWIGTSSGLARLKGGRWTRFSQRDGLASDSIAYLLDDTLGGLWIGSNKGLMQASREELDDYAAGRATSLTLRVYRREDGLPISECTAGSQPAACRTRDGRLWFPTIKGLVSVRPEELRINTNPPPVIIEAVYVENTPWQASGLGSKPDPLLELPPRRERVTFHYTSLNLGASERARFRYRLEGHESGWTEVGNVRVAHYSRLPAGDYRFVVTACNEDGVWNETGAAIAVVVLPPIWATWWFRTIVAGVVLGIVAGIVFYVSTQKLQRQLASMKQQEVLEKERARIARDIHDQLGANLTQLALLGELVETDKDSPPDIEGHARQICQTSRDTARTLDEIVWTVNPSNDTLEGVINYVCKYAQEYLAVAGLKYRLEVPPQVPEASIAPEVRHNIFLAAKEAITNIVRHSHASSAWLRLHLGQNRFTLELADDGRGLAKMDPVRAATRNGLTNMRRRMEDVGGTFELDQRPEGGAVVRLTVPFQPVVKKA